MIEKFLAGFNNRPRRHGNKNVPAERRHPFILLILHYLQNCIQERAAPYPRPTIMHLEGQNAGRTLTVDTKWNTIFCCR